MQIGTVLRLLVVAAAIPSAAYAAGAERPASLDAPAKAPAGSRVMIKWTGPGNSMDRIGVVPAGAPDATFPKRLPCYPATSHPATVGLPDQPGEYELRYLSFLGGKSPRAQSDHGGGGPGHDPGSRVGRPWLEDLRCLDRA